MLPFSTFSIEKTAEPEMSLVTVATFSNAFNMHVLKGRLEAEGILAVPKDEHTVTTNPFYSGALGGIKLQVREEDVAEAQRILAEAGYVQPYIPPQPEVKRRHPLVLFLIYLLCLVAVLGLIYVIHDPLAYLAPSPERIVLPLPSRQ